MNQAQQLRDGIQALGLDIDEAKQAKLPRLCRPAAKVEQNLQSDRTARRGKK